jgi:hypothetical protein
LASSIVRCHSACHFAESAASALDESITKSASTVQFGFWIFDFGLEDSHPASQILIFALLHKRVTKRQERLAAVTVLQSKIQNLKSKITFSAAPSLP